MARGERPSATFKRVQRPGGAKPASASPTAAEATTSPVSTDAGEIAHDQSVRAARLPSLLDIVGEITERDTQPSMWLPAPEPVISAVPFPVATHRSKSKVSTIPYSADLCLL